MSKIIFLDVDGTLVDFRQEMRQLTKTALIEAKKNGHKLVLCTGRTYSTIYPWLLEYFDGVVASAGAHVVWNNEEIYHSYIDKADLLKVRDVLEKHKAGYLFQGTNGRFLDKINSVRMMNFFKNLGITDVPEEFEHTLIENPHDRDDIESGVYHDAEVGIEQIQKEVGSGVKITGASFGEERMYNGEFTKYGVNKATGIEKVLKHLKLKKEDTVAFGDGPNDFEMIEYVEIGVAMGNAVDELKEIADMVTDEIGDDGLYKGFAKLGIIE